MAITATTIMSVIGVGMSAVGGIQQGQAQQQQAQFQSDMAARNATIAEQNAQLAEEEGRESKKIGYENAVKKRQEAAGIIGGQRAAQAASGVTVDTGSTLDLNLDTAEKGELDAFALQDQGAQQDYLKRVEAWNLREQGTGQQLQSKMYSQASNNSPWLSAGGSLFSGLSQAGSNYYKMTSGSNTTPKNSTRIGAPQRILDNY